MAARIRDRAMRRAGELAKLMMQPNHRPAADKYDGGDILMSKAKVQEVSGFSERQLRTALNVARDAGMSKQMMQPHGGDRKSDQVTTDHNLMPRERVDYWGVYGLPMKAPAKKKI